jgi:hypothetical protein
MEEGRQIWVSSIKSSTTHEKVRLHVACCIVWQRQPWCAMSQPHFGQVWGWSPTLAKLGIWNPPGLPNVQSSASRPKTPHIEVFLVSLKRSWSVEIENGLALVIQTSAAQVMVKEGPGVKLAIWFPTTKSRESTSSRHPNWECDMALERSQRGLRL